MGQGCLYHIYSMSSPKKKITSVPPKVGKSKVRKKLKKSDWFTTPSLTTCHLDKLMQNCEFYCDSVVFYMCDQLIVTIDKREKNHFIFKFLRVTILFNLIHQYKHDMIFYFFLFNV